MTLFTSSATEPNHVIELVVAEGADGVEEVEEVVERLDVEVGRGEGGVSGESELSDQAGEEDVDSVSAVDNSDSPAVPDVASEWRFGWAQRESQWLVRGGVGVGEADGEYVDMLLVQRDASGTQRRG